jgi:hypothetical protein
MISARLEAYLSRLQHELQKHGPVDTTIIDEVREHLLDAVAAGLRRGLSVDAAEQEAFVRFGPPEMVAAGFAKERYPMLKRLVIVLCQLGRLLRGTAPHPQRHGATPAHYHDVGPSRYHFALRLKRPFRNRLGRMSVDEQRQFIAQMRERGEDVSAFQTDPRERLVRFLEEFGRRTFGSTGTLESLTLLEDTTDSTKRGGRYLAAFGGGSKMIWSVALSADGAVSFDGTSAAA